MMITVPHFQTHIHHAARSGNAGVRGTHRGVPIIAFSNHLRLRPQKPGLPPSPPTNYILLLWEQCSIQFSMSVLRMRLTPYIVDRPQFRYHYEMFEDHRALSRCPYYNVSEGRVKYTDGVDADFSNTLGFEETGFPNMIRCILIHAQQYEYDETAVY